MPKLFMIDDDEALCRSLQLQLDDEGHELAYASSCTKARTWLSHPEADLVLLDLQLPDGTGIELLPEIKSLAPDIPVVMVTSRQDMTATIEAMRLGAFDYLRKPFDLEEILLLITKAKIAAKPFPARTIPAEVEDLPPREIIGQDPKVLDLLKQIGRLSTSRTPVLIVGESGTGKELVAHALHHAVTPDSPFVAVNCSAVVPTLFESELFGHEKGAFTGADQRRIGKMEQAAAGTLFLDEVGDMPLEQQAKLLRALQEREFERVGGTAKIPLQARIIAATNRDLPAQIQTGRFREDLFYRLAVATLPVPPLRERRNDLPLLVRCLLGRLAHEMDRPGMTMSEDALLQLERHDWPGNIRELENVLTRAIALAPGQTVGPEQLQLQPMGKAAQHQEHDPSTLLPLREVERRHIEKVLHALDWNITRSAITLQIAQNTLRKKISDYKIRPA